MLVACGGRGGETPTTAAHATTTPGAIAAGEPASGASATSGGAEVAPAAATPRGATPSTWTALGNGIRWKRTTVPGESNNVLEWLVVRVEVPNVTLRAIPAQGEALALPANDANTMVVINAGFFDPQHRPSGTLISAGTDLGVANARGGSGTLVVRSGRAEIVDAALTLVRAPAIDLAVQCGPRLIETSGTPGIYRDDGQRFARTAVCTRDA